MAMRKGESLDERTALIEMAERLGYEVGLKGHLDNIGEIGARKREILSRARELGILEKVMFKYASSKDNGIKERRLSIYSQPQPQIPTKPAAVPSEEARPFTRPIMPAPIKSSPQESVPGIEGLEKFLVDPHALIELVEMTEIDATAKYQRFYETLLNIADVSNEVRYVRGKETLDKMLAALQKNGWIRKYSLLAFSPGTGEILVELESVYAKHHEPSKKPVCRIIAYTISKAASVAAGREIRVIETKCMSQGFKKCEFSSY